jgi:alpha-mannosidase
VDGIPVESLFFDGENKTPIFSDSNKDIIPGMLYYYDDIPLFWDAWDVMDYHLETRRLPDGLEETEAVANFATGDIVGGYKWGAKFGNGSSFTRYTILRANSPMLE